MFFCPEVSFWKEIVLWRLPRPKSPESSLVDSLECILSFHRQSRHSISVLIDRKLKKKKEDLKTTSPHGEGWVSKVDALNKPFWFKTLALNYQLQVVLNFVCGELVNIHYP